MEIRWVTAMIDCGEADFVAVTQFWLNATQATLSASRGDQGEFATIVPANGDAFLRVQRTADGSNGVHLDFHVESIGRARDHAVGLGASVVAERGYAVMSSPAGYVFCIVSHHGESIVPNPITAPQIHAVDQVSIDIPPDRYDDECGFWSAFTGWALQPSTLAEFTALDRPAGMPLRLLLQRLGPDDASAIARAHLDIACGSHIEALAVEHELVGARRLGPTKRWMRMADPAGIPYCLTPREPRI